VVEVELQQLPPHGLITPCQHQQQQPKAGSKARSTAAHHYQVPCGGIIRSMRHAHISNQSMQRVHACTLQTNGTLYLTNMGRLSAVWGFI
jgi:hypothetical protein